MKRESSRQKRGGEQSGADQMFQRKKPVKERNQRERAEGKVPLGKKQKRVGDVRGRCGEGGSL